MLSWRFREIFLALFSLIQFHVQVVQNGETKLGMLHQENSSASFSKRVKIWYESLRGNTSEMLKDNLTVVNDTKY